MQHTSKGLQTKWKCYREQFWLHDLHHPSKKKASKVTHFVSLIIFHLLSLQSSLLYTKPSLFRTYPEQAKSQNDSYNVTQDKWGQTLQWFMPFLKASVGVAPSWSLLLFLWLSLTEGCVCTEPPPTRSLSNVFLVGFFIVTLLWKYQVSGVRCAMSAVFI